MDYNAFIQTWLLARNNKTPTGFDFVGGVEEAEKLHKLGKLKSPSLNKVNPAGLYILYNIIKYIIFSNII